MATDERTRLSAELRANRPCYSGSENHRDILMRHAADALDAQAERIRALEVERDARVEFCREQVARTDAAEDRAEQAEADNARLRALIADDSFAIQFQTLGQYRAALLKGAK